MADRDFMGFIRRQVQGRWSRSLLWSDASPVRDELFGVERLEQHALSLAAAQPVTTTPPSVLSLNARLNDNAEILLAAYRSGAAALEAGQDVVPAAEWLLDNYHLVEEQIREIRDDLPPGYYRQLPKLAAGPFAGYPRVLGVAWAFVAHTDSHLDPEILRRFILAYQRVQPLTIGELWAVAITLRIILIENLRRLADQIAVGRSARADADALADRLFTEGCARTALEDDILTRSDQPLSQMFAAQLAKRLRDQDPETTPALGWLEERLKMQDTTIDQVVQGAQQRQGASYVTVRNVFTSMRRISDIDWADFFESVSPVDERLRKASAFATMDFPTRNLYRSAIEQLARGSKSTELEVADHALMAAGAAAEASDAIEADRVGDPGYHLIAGGRLALERRIGFVPPPRLRLGRFNLRLGIGGLIGANLLVATALLGLVLWVLSRGGLGIDGLALVAVAGFLPATEVATALLNRAVNWSFGASALPGLELATGVPPSLRTLVAVPTLLTGEADLLEQVERLEVHYLSGAGGDLAFALLTDGTDADQEVVEGDARLLALATRTIDELNRRHGPGPAGNRFILLHRRRIFNAGENKWMGWERKRGKLHELNRLLRGATDTTVMVVEGRPPQVPAKVRYVITLDADTRLPRDAALRLIGKMAHPLNRPKFLGGDGIGPRVVDGYAILQPRVTPSLPRGSEGSLHQRVFSGPSGIDPYAAAVSDVYQDLFGEGSYTGKGIYDVDAFEAALVGRVPENTLLSHDLFEGIFARAGLASDVEVVEEFPSRYDVASKRQHRWTRGDWQLLPWIIRPDHTVPPIGRGKMVDNLRRSLVAPATLLALGACWLLPLPSGILATLFLLAGLALPAFLPTVLSILPQSRSIHLRNHVDMLASDLRLAAWWTFLSTAFLADQAWRMADAIIRTLVRLLVTRRHLLEWTTAAQSGRSPRLDLGGFYRQMAGGVALGLFVATGAAAVHPSSWPLALPFALLWLMAPALAVWASRPPVVAPANALSHEDARQLRLIARRTWRYFETFVTPSDNMLPPDNFQEDPRPVVAHRTSPTNIGLYLLSAVAARDFGWAGTVETVERLEATFESMRKLARFKGHFFNWYETQTLHPLDPAYISSVDSGNLAGHLIALANACEEWGEALLAPCARLGMKDDLWLLREAVGNSSAARNQPLSLLVDEIDALLGSGQTVETLSPALTRLLQKAARVAVPPDVDDGGALNLTVRPDSAYWIGALRQAVAEHGRDRIQVADAPHLLKVRLAALADTARKMAMSMDFAFLVDPDRKLLAIGYSLIDNSLASSCYDLLASEARLASLFAVAKGDVTTRHWFRLGRAATPLGNGSALISWSGSMFEYLMPSLVMRAPVGSLLEQTNRLVVERQQAYGDALGVPWGVSESAYNARDLEFTYQYSNFGVPGLGLKRGLSQNVVIAPYATGLAAMVNPHGAMRNYGRLAAMGALGRHGFFEALDFTRSRIPGGDTFAIVRTYMAHHQGMTIVALANTLLDGLMRDRFHREPMILASELLLQERMPRSVAIVRSRVEEVTASPPGAITEPAVARRLVASDVTAPITHLLSNGHYVVMLTATGAGYSRWRDLAVTRWREDSTRDDWGSFIFLRDLKSGTVWSASAQPIGRPAESEDVVFGEDHAEFIRRDSRLTTSMEVVVSGEIDGEVRRVSLANGGRRMREIELTSYAELVLAPAAADDAHPVFSKMFVETEHLAEFGALVATRRPRSPAEPRIWAAHFAVVEGDTGADPEYETDRARFVGRGRAVGTAAAILDGRKLSNTVGIVLDPIFSLRCRVAIPPGKVVRIAFWTLVASSRTELLDLVDKHHDRNAFGRAKTLAWTQAQVQLRHLDVRPAEAAEFQRLATPLLYADRRFRASPAAIARGAGPQSGLWSLSISGDRPIVLLRIDDLADLAQVRQLLRAHEYWRMKGLSVDLVIINEEASSYTQDLQVAIETAVRSSQSRRRIGMETAQGSVYSVRADLMSVETRERLLSVARIVLIARRGTIADHLSRLPPRLNRHSSSHRRGVPSPLPESPPTPSDLEFFNGLGGFDKDGTEYVILLDGGRTTPAPWINVIANPGFGFQVAAEGSGYTWAENSRENQLTPWSNDPVTDPSGEAFYVRDERNFELWTATAQPIRDNGRYVARHGHGYSRFEHLAHGIALDLLQYVALNDPVKISRLTLHNRSDAPRRLSITAYADWVLGTSRGASAPFIITGIDELTGAMTARNPWNVAFSGRVAFADLGGRQTSWTADRSEFLGFHGQPSAPAALAWGMALSGATGAGLDPCAALQCVVELGAGESVEILSLFGQCPSVAEARSLIQRYRDADLDAVLAEVTGYWASVLGAVQVKTPDRAMDIMLNGWLLYQTLACRLWARAALYQTSGAYGFRDQIQDGMALALARPDETRSHLLRAAARQFVEGDVQHWWLPQSGQGVRTRISDDRVWLVFATATYVASSGDTAVLDEIVPYLDGPNLHPDDTESVFQPMISDHSASLFDHCALALDGCLGRTGDHGLPLIGTGDWNDGMNRLGVGGKGESVWLGWMLVRTVALFAPLAEERESGRSRRWTSQADEIREAIERQAWDGEWYRRATFDDGTWIGGRADQECRIDSIAQSWAVLSEAADPARAATAMRSLDRHLIVHADGVALLFSPPFDRTPLDPGYIKGYPPGLRENGGQYSHAAMWAVLAFAKMGEGDKAAELFTLLNPINHALTPAAVERYKVEPYVVAADIYSVAPHVGRGGWTWYTGAAGWMYRAGIEGILGIRREGAFLVVAPCLPAAWTGFEARIAIESTRYDIRVEATMSDMGRVILDGLPFLPGGEGVRLRLPLDGGTHTVTVCYPAMRGRN